MEKKRYQVFVSSTYVDLKDARSAVFDTLTKIDCIPAGMEVFPAFDEEQLEYIKSIIDDSDYYILIIGGRYGSVSADGVSFTEKEYDYAVSKNIPVLSFIHSAPDSIPVGLTDKDMEKRERLDAFIQRARQGRLVQEWKDVSELSLRVTQAVMHSIKAKPGIGWMRGSAAATVEILTEINDLRKENENLKKELLERSKVEKHEISDIAPLDAIFTVRFSCQHTPMSQKVTRNVDFSWKELFALVGPAIMEKRKGDNIGNALTAYLKEGRQINETYIYINNEDRDTIKFQLIGYNFVEPCENSGGGALRLTELGENTLLKLKAVRAGALPSKK
jgi:hypothetical protein